MIYVSGVRQGNLEPLGPTKITDDSIDADDYVLRCKNVNQGERIRRAIVDGQGHPNDALQDAIDEQKHKYQDFGGTWVVSERSDGSVACELVVTERQAESGD